MEHGIEKIILDLCGFSSWSKFYKENNYDVRIYDANEWGNLNESTDIRLSQTIKVKNLWNISCSHHVLILLVVVLDGQR